MKLTPDIVIQMPGESRVHRTALDELARTLSATSAAQLRVSGVNAAPPGSLHLALLDESVPARNLVSHGRINLHKVAPETDAFEIMMHEGVLFVLGNTPRGLLQAVYQLQETVVFQGELPDDFHSQGAFQIPRRIFHQRFDSWPGERADVCFISHLGATHCLTCHDWNGRRRNLQGYVTSPIFPDAVDEGTVVYNRNNLRRLLDDCADYALDACLWLTELPCQGGPWVAEQERARFLARFPEEILSDSGTYEGKVLCFSHSRVQEFYRDLLGRFFAEFPEIAILFVFGLDSRGEFCDPKSCPRCRGLSRFDQRDRLIRFLVEEGSKARPGLRVLTTGWEWDRDSQEFLRRQMALPSASGVYLAAEKDGWQPERQSHDFMRETRRICSDRGQLFIGYDNFHWGDDTVHKLKDIQDYPLGIGAKIRRWHQLHVDGVFDHWGGWNEDISSNSMACREFFLNPLADANLVCREIALRQFGRDSGELVFAAWQALEQAHTILSNHCTWSPGQWPAWYSGRHYAPIPAEFKKVRGDCENSSLPARSAGPFTYNGGDLATRLQGVSDSWREALPHYHQAIACMHRAIQRADGKTVGYAFWWSGAAVPPNRQEHLRRQLRYLESMAVVGREIGLHFGLHALCCRCESNEASYREQAAAMLAEDRTACLAVAEYFETLRPWGDDPQSRIDWVQAYREKAAAIDAWLLI